MKQSEIWIADLNPVKGSEQKGLRPVLIISGNMLNQNLQVVITCPLTSHIKGYKGNPVLIPSAENGLKEISEVVVFQIRSISKERLVEKIGSVSLEQLNEIKTTLTDILRY
jgi:mRNA interferase MazF